MSTPPKLQLCCCVQIDGGPCQNLPDCPVREIKILLEEGNLPKSACSDVKVDAKDRATNLGCSFCQRHMYHQPWCPKAMTLQWAGRSTHVALLISNDDYMSLRVVLVPPGQDVHSSDRKWLLPYFDSGVGYHLMEFVEIMGRPQQ